MADLLRRVAGATDLDSWAALVDLGELSEHFGRLSLAGTLDHTRTLVALLPDPDAANGSLCLRRSCSGKDSSRPTEVVESRDRVSLIQIGHDAERASPRLHSGDPQAQRDAKIVAVRKVRDPHLQPISLRLALVGQQLEALPELAPTKQAQGLLEEVWTALDRLALTAASPSQDPAPGAEDEVASLFPRQPVAKHQHLSWAPLSDGGALTTNWCSGSEEIGFTLQRPDGSTSHLALGLETPALRLVEDRPGTTPARIERTTQALLPTGNPDELWLIAGQRSIEQRVPTFE